MKPVNIYILIKSGQVIYTGASHQPTEYIQTRHWNKLGYYVSVEIVDVAHTVEEAADLEEYWFWYFRSLGFTMLNKLPFRRYKAGKPEEFSMELTPELMALLNDGRKKKAA